MKNLKIFQLIFFLGILIVFSFFIIDFAEASCDDQDGWYNVGSSYSCQRGTESCTCQNQEYRDYSEGCINWGQSCINWAQRCTNYAQRCVSTAQRCVSLAQRCVSTAQRCVSLAQRCVSTAQRCLSLGWRCTSYAQRCSQCSRLVCAQYGQERYCKSSGYICPSWWRSWMGTWLCSWGCKSWGTRSVCVSWRTEYYICNCGPVYCASGYYYCTGYETYCTRYETYCTRYETYCTGYETYCTNWQTYCTNWETYCSQYETFCTAYGCAPRVTNTRTLYTNCRSANQPPSSTNLKVVQPDYCVCGPVGTFSWTFTDPDPGDTQSAYQVQVDKNSNFSSPEDDSGKVTSSSNSYATILGKLKYNKTYYWRVKVWDSKGAESVWISGPSFTTPKHAYPSIDVKWAPLNPSINEEVLFTDQSTVHGGASKKNWSWTFQDGNPTSSNQQNPTVKFSSVGPKQITLTVTDSDDFTCPGSKTLNAEFPLPIWKEIAPF